MSQGNEVAITIRPAQRSDLDAINGVLDAALTTRPDSGPARAGEVPHPHYHAIDLDIDLLLLAVSARQHILGVAACRRADPQEVPSGMDAVLLDGPYVHPLHSHQGIGSQLLDEARALARRQGRDGLLVKPLTGSDSFFQSHGMQILPDAQGPAPRYWQSFA